MKESYGEGLASHTGPESWRAAREDGTTVRGADGVRLFGRQHRLRRYREPWQDPAWSETSRMHGNSSRRTWETPRSTAAVMERPPAW